MSNLLVKHSRSRSPAKLRCQNKVEYFTTVKFRLCRKDDNEKGTMEEIVVDDCSKDRTEAVLERVFPIVDRIICHRVNRGKGAALRSVFAVATGDIVLIQDVDLEYSPQDYPVLLEPFRAGKADVVFGSRFMGGRPHRVLFLWHMVANRFLILRCEALRWIRQRRDLQPRFGSRAIWTPC